MVLLSLCLVGPSSAQSPFVFSPGRGRLTSEEAKSTGGACKKMARFYWLVVAAPEDGGRASRQEAERKRAP